MIHPTTSSLSFCLADKVILSVIWAAKTTILIGKVNDDALRQSFSRMTNGHVLSAITEFPLPTSPLFWEGLLVCLFMPKHLSP